MLLNTVEYDLLCTLNINNNLAIGIYKKIGYFCNTLYYGRQSRFGTFLRYHRYGIWKHHDSNLFRSGQFIMFIDYEWLRVW